MNTPKTRTPNCHTPAESKPTNAEQRARRTRYQILADSEVNRDLYRIREAAERLEQMIEQFQDSCDRDMTDVQCRDAGITAIRGLLSTWRQDAIEEVLGLRWAVTKYLGTCHELGDRPDDRDDEEAATPAIVQA
jgi:hypothetical protein